MTGLIARLGPDVGGGRLEAIVVDSAPASHVHSEVHHLWGQLGVHTAAFTTQARQRKWSNECGLFVIRAALLWWRRGFVLKKANPRFESLAAWRLALRLRLVWGG